MPYETNSGSFERASRLGHSEAALRALADAQEFYVPTDALSDIDWLDDLIVDPFAPGQTTHQITSAIAVDGSHVTHRIRDGLPSVVYGFAQAAAAYVDLQVMEDQRAEQFPDPVAIHRAVNSALISVDLPVAGAYSRQGASIKQSWRELVDHLFRTKRIEVNRINQTLEELLFRLHGTPAQPSTALPVGCPACPRLDIDVPVGGRACPDCSEPLFPTDTLRVYESVVEDGENAAALGRLRSVIELLVLVGLSTLLWQQSRTVHLPSTLFIMDGPLAMYGEPAKLRGWAEDYFQQMTSQTPGLGPFICGVEKTGAMVDFGEQLARNDVLQPGQLLICDERVIARVTNAANSAGYGKETYWGRKFIYRCKDGRTVVLTVPAESGPAYDSRGGQPGIAGYPTLPVILDVVDRTGSTMYRNGIIPVAAAHGRAAFPIGVGTDVLRLVAERRLGFS